MAPRHPRIVDDLAQPMYALPCGGSSAVRRRGKPRKRRALHFLPFQRAHVSPQHLEIVVAGVQRAQIAAPALPCVFGDGDRIGDRRTHPPLCN